MGNINPMIRIGDAYHLEQLGLNDLELPDQFSCSLNKDQKSDGNGNWDNNTGFEVIDSADYAFPNLGSFSIEFLYNKVRPDEIRNVGEPGHQSIVSSPIIRKGSMINVYISDSYFYSPSTEGLTVTMFGNRTVRVLASNYPVFEKTNHVIITYDVIQTDINQWDSYLRVYLNGRLWQTSKVSHVDDIPITDVTDSWFIGKNPTGNNPTTDWNTERLTLDQLAIYDYAFNEEQVMHHYRKTKSYKNLIKDDFPNHYWPFNDSDDISSDVVDAEVGIDGKIYYDAISDVHRGLAGPEKLTGSGSTEFANTSMASVTSTSQILDPSSNYTVEFWFKSGEGRRRVLLSCTEETRGWDGLTIWINSKNGEYEDGRIQVYESLNQSIVSISNDPDTNVNLDWSDQLWHHMAIKRTATTLSMYIDGVAQASATFGRVAKRGPLQLHIMGSGPGSLSTNGSISNLVIYQYAMQEMQIVNRWLFTTRYKISGYTLLQGNPVSADVRFYSHYSGELVESLKSNIATGLYTYYPETNRLLDVVSFIPENRTTRYRIHGPVRPAEYDDSHLG